MIKNNPPTKNVKGMDDVFNYDVFNYIVTRSASVNKKRKDCVGGYHPDTISYPKGYTLGPMVFYHPQQYLDFSVVLCLC